MRPRDCADPPPLFLHNSVVKVLGPPPHDYVPLFRRRPPHVPPANPKAPVSLVWFRGHDLRLHDHAALDAAVASRATIVALYILECGPENDAAVAYIRRLSSRYANDTSPTASSSHSDVMSSITSDSASPSPSTPFREPRPSRIPLESDREPWGPLSPNGGFALGRVQRWYLHHSLSVLRHQLETLGITLILRRVDSAEDVAPVVASVANALGAGAVFWNKRYKPHAYPIDEAVSSSLRKRAISSQEFDSETLMEPSMTRCGHYNDFQSYTRFWIDAMRVSPPPRPNTPIEKTDVVAMERSRIHHLLAQANTRSASVQSAVSSNNGPLPSVADLQLLKGLSLEGADSPGDVDAIGCVAAHRAVRSFLQQDRFSRFACGAARRDGMVTREDLATSRLSPHVRFGEISPRVLFYEIVDAGAAAKDSGNMQGLEAARTFLKNMSLREFGYYMLSRYPSAAFKPIIPEFEVFPWEEDGDGALARAWETGTTGFPIVDAAMRQLLREGWLHNRMRFLAASFFCKYLLLPWPVGAAHLVRTLVDGDEACNSLGWQWTAGCNSDSFPFSTLVNPLSLYTHTQSRRRAADYVRKYVPELAHLPDRLVFTPWKATDKERAKYNLTLLPLRKYSEVCRHTRYCPGSAGELVYYPARVVTGKDARFRARRAMEVMRRIFAAQRRCRTIIGEQELSDHRVHDRKHPRFHGVEMTTKKQRTVEGVQVMDTDGKPVVELDVSGLDSNVSYVSDVTSSRKVAECRQRESDDPETGAVSRKRRRTTAPPSESPKPETRTSREAPKISGRPMMSIAELSSPEIHPNPQGMQGLSRQYSNGDISSEATKGCRSMQTESRKNATGGARGKCTSPRSLKRPRPVTPNITQKSSERLSVKSLLSPSLAPDIGMVRRQSPSALLQSSRGSPMVPSTGVNAIPQLSQDPRCQNATFANGRLPNDPTTPELFANLPRRLVASSPPLPSDPRPLQIPNPRTPQIMRNSGMQGKAPTHRTANEGMVTPQASGLVARSPVSPFHYRGSPTHITNSVGLNVGRVSEGDSAMVGSSTNVRVPGPHAQVKRDMAGPVPSVELHRPQAPTVFHHSVSPLSLITGQYQHSQHHNPQMMVSLRPPPSNHMQVPAHMSHAASAIASPNASQGYFATNPVSATPHQPAGQQVLWYSTLPPYVELRSPGLPGTVLPHVIHPMARQHPHAMPMGYPIPGAGPIGTQGDPNRMVHQAGLPVPFAEADGAARRGPGTPMEREAIARRMAAMDYQDDNYGGKHWEQWQAISLHLLNQYEFSEDTDRETSRAYVRLCVLKDELRDANPNGPRVTVNHCKEVFRILNLPVTGEWDRRGHGGVRGPYVYGCVKKSGVQVTRR